MSNQPSTSQGPRVRRGRWFLYVDGVRSADSMTKAEAKALARDLRYAFGRNLPIAIRQERS